MHKIFNKGNNNPIRKKITDRIDLFIKEMYNMARGDNMLTKFSVTNFRNFKDKLTIDFEDKHEYKFNEIATKNGIISKSIIFGKNGYGKSNLGFALFDIIITITDLHANSEVYDNNKFINADSNLKYAEFNYEFKFGSDIVNYNYKKSEPKTLVYEELIINDKKIYDFDFQKKQGNFKNLNIISAETLNFDTNNINIAILKFVANNTVQKEGATIKLLLDFVSHMLWFRSLENNAFIGMHNEIVELSDWIVKNNLMKEFEEFLKNMANLNLEIRNTQIGNKNILLEEHKNKQLVFDETASSGTKSLQLFFYWSKRFKEVSFLFVDEFDAFYHFELSRNIIEFILQYKNMQAILTSHNTYLANNNLLRPDCYFILKDGKIKTFVDRTDRELREGHNIEKMLREGEFDE